MHDVANPAALTAHFRSYIRQLNQRLPTSLRMYLAPRVNYNGRRMSAESFAALVCPPGATLSSEFVVADVSKRLLAARIEVEVPQQSVTVPSSPTMNGVTPDSPSPDELRRGSAPDHMREHVFYHFDENWRIDEVWSVGEKPRPESPKRPRERLGRRMSIPQEFEEYRF